MSLQYAHVMPWIRRSISLHIVQDKHSPTAHTAIRGRSLQKILPDRILLHFLEEKRIQSDHKAWSYFPTVLCQLAEWQL